MPGLDLDSIAEMGPVEFDYEMNRDSLTSQTGGAWLVWYGLVAYIHLIGFVYCLSSWFWGTNLPFKTFETSSPLGGYHLEV